MSRTPDDDKLATLLAQVDEAIELKQLAKAADLLREASQIKADDVEVKKRWLKLQNQEGAVDGAAKVLQRYLESGKDEDGHKVIQALEHIRLSPVAANAAYDLLLGADKKLGLLDELTGTLLGRQFEVQKRVAAALVSNATEVFERMFHTGTESFKAFAGVPLDNAVWSSKEAQVAAQQDVFRLCIATLMEAGVERPESLMRAIARQLAIQPDSVACLIDEDVFDVILADLDIRLDSTLRSQAMLSTSKLLEVSQQAGETLFAEFVTVRVAKQTNDDLIRAFSAAAAVFPILPAVAAKLFMTDGFVQQLVPNLERNSDAAVAGKRKSKTLEQAALELLSAACIDKACRGAIERYCTHWLLGLSDEREGVHKALAALVLAKVSEHSVDEVTEKLFVLVLQEDAESSQAIEGLAYTSLQPKIKETIASNRPLLQSLVAALKDRPASAFGTLTVFCNMTAYRQTQSEETKKMSQIKAYANSMKPTTEDPLDGEKRVTARCKKLLDHDAVPALVACCKQTRSPTSIALVVRVLLAVAKEQKHRVKMAQQGAVRLLLQIHNRTATTDKSTSEAALIERGAAHCLARLLISVNPAHVFSSGLPATSAVSALVLLLLDDSGSEQRDLLPTFEALLALTNLASMEDPTARELIVRSSFEKIEDLLFSPNTLVQRASVELVCNLMASPSCVAKFADGSKDAQRRMQILLALSDVEDLAARRAAGGALAMLTEWDAAVDAVLGAKEGKGVKSVLVMCQDDNEEMKHRGLVCVTNLVNAPDEAGIKAMATIKELGGMEIVREALKGTRNPDILKIGVELLKKLG
ncbi:hypothetical protein LTR36_004263 [Oleoguttula mirabilis]|uniref:UNC-45/Cro1/She4 central domain-containing protein n=1 Tax=Oleoguttula mirabilis TaxID=1507867 RepID=A0AAV9JH06_9PEZI|nr:hypothetical protein LTR36_004263 [Oleoguttula mirabilis]